MKRNLIIVGLLAIGSTTAQIPIGGGISGGGGSPSANVLSGGIATLPAASVVGRLFIPTDSYYQFLRDNGSSWQYFINGKPVTPPVSGNFSWANQNTSTATTQTNGASVLGFACNGATLNLSMWFFAAPATPYTRTFRIKPDVNWGVSTTVVGIGFMESATGKISQLILQGGTTGGGFTVYNFTNFTTFSASPPGNNAFGVVNTAFAGNDGIILQVGDNGTNLTYSWSQDGVNFWTGSTVARNSFFTTAPDRVGVIGNCQLASGGPMNVTLISVD